MPTDPFVPSDPSARPRQQQNLPPGVALPPATDWRSDRPGDLGPEQPEGALFGRPGPNVGYAYTLAQRAKDRLRTGPYEHVEDAVAVIAEVAGKRAAQFGRAPVIGDVDLAIALLGYDGSASEAFVKARSALVHGSSHDYLRRRGIVDAVPDALLRVRSPHANAEIDAWRASLPAPAPSG
ncbi:MAG TPA: hypothetical protein VGP92_19315 [Acidimicrobiia bacterium]|nr:hypothetical protein [Acidimicrobiia bacterium]